MGEAAQMYCQALPRFLGLLPWQRSIQEGRSDRPAGCLWRSLGRAGRMMSSPGTEGANQSLGK